jgi:hypothetical protein
MDSSEAGGSFIPSFMDWTAYTPVIPKLYWDIYSQEERIKRLCKQYDKLCHYSSAIANQVNLNTTELAEIAQEFEDFKNSGFYDYYKQQVKDWIENNLALLYEMMAKQVFFGLTKDGHFCAYVPDSWQDIQFDTGAVYGRSDYGRLILRMNVDGDNAIDNTYSYTLAQNTTTEQIQSDLELNTQRTDATYKTLFTNIDTEV